MAIDYNADILSLYAGDVITDAAYQSPGTFGLPTGFGVNFNLSGGVVHTPGTTYLVGDHITLSGGTHSVAAILRVTGINGVGGVTDFTIFNPGIYTVVSTATNPLSTTTNSVGGSGFQFDAVFSGYAHQRLLTFIEIMRTYLVEIDNVHEAKMLQEIVGRIMAAMRFGTPTWNASVVAAKAQADSLNYLAHHPSLPIDT